MLFETKDLTGTFEATTSPARQGVYCTSDGDLEVRWQYFDGEKWHASGETVEEAMENFFSADFMPSEEDHTPATWTGLKRDPNAPMPKPNDIWRHLESNITYMVIMLSNTGSTKPEAFPVTVVYVTDEGSIWSRPLDQFMEKFELVPAEPIE